MVRRLAKPIPDNPYTFNITVVKSDVVNAFALPGGYIVVFTGLMKKAENAEEVAGVLAHELNHVLQRHGLERIVKQLGFVAVVSIVETTIRWTSSEDGATVTYERHGVVERRATIMANAMGYRLVEENGKVLSETEYAADGTVRLLNGECQVVMQWNEEQLEAIAGDPSAMVAEAGR
ncbi:MAG: M48 family metallopeptidase [Nitrospira sp.]|nr:M48 family metallopeptidase [Nitrospira sp.]